MQHTRGTGAQLAAARDFVGRERELEQIGALLLSPSRLITLVGSGGIGKTRLATEIVHRFRKARRVPVYWVRLARLFGDSDARAVEDEIAQSVLDVDFSGRSAWEAVVDTLSRRDAVGRDLQTILVMDNCEHVINGACRVIDELLDAVPGLTVLATSREAIGWVDEQLVSVPSLSGKQALVLFRQRAELTGHSIAGDEQVALATSICRRVDHHPLYIRLAAARLLRQPLPMILRDLSGEASDRRLRWSHGPRVGAEERHRGIRDVIAWSFDLCRDKERLLLERMSVFAAGYDVDPDDGTSRLDVGAELEAIEVVCADPDAGVGGEQVVIARGEVEDLLERLVDQSLVSVHLTTTVRYSLLESVRVFAQQRLLERAGEQEWSRLAGRHRRYYRDKIVRVQTEWFSQAERDLLEWACAAWDNVRRAIDGSLATVEEAVIGLQIAVGLVVLRVSFFKGSLREGRKWVERTLAATRDLALQPVEDRQLLELQIAAMSQIVWISMCQGMPEDAEQVLDECVATCCAALEAGAGWRDDPEIDLGLPAPVELAWGIELMLVQCDARAVTVLGRAREKFAAGGDRGGAGFSEMFEAMAAGLHGTPSQALDITRRHLDNATASGAQWATSWAELIWAIALTTHGDPEEALAVGRAALARQLAMRDPWGALWAVHIRAWSLARLVADSRVADDDRPDRLKEWALEIARLIGGAAVFRGKLGVNIANMGPYGTETDKAADIARQMLGRTAFAAAEQEGAALRPELNEVERLALGTLSLDKLPGNHPVRRHRPSRWQELSTAERDVAILAAAGWTNTAIAVRRGSSTRTVDAQMAVILHKLMITSRADIITLIPADQRARIANEAARRPQLP